MSESNGAPQANLIKALVRAQAKFPTIPKNRTATVQMKSGGTYKYQYADLADIMIAVRPVLNAEGLAITQAPIGGPGGLALVTTLWHESGERLEISTPLHVAGDATPQVVGSAITYYRRYALGALLGIVTDEDDDATIAERSRNGGHEKAAPAAAAKKPEAAASRAAPAAKAPAKATPIANGTKTPLQAAAFRFKRACEEGGAIHHLWETRFLGWSKEDATLEIADFRRLVREAATGKSKDEDLGPDDYDAAIKWGVKALSDEDLRDLLTARLRKAGWSKGDEEGGGSGGEEEGAVTDLFEEGR